MTDKDRGLAARERCLEQFRAGWRIGSLHTVAEFAAMHGLTASERGVLHDLVHGHAASDIAAARNIAVGTVRAATPGADVPAYALSGGNQQKLIVGREMEAKPKVLIAAHPTRGVDVGAQAAIWDHIREARRRGLAVLLVSADLDELIGLSDSLKVILRGRFVGDFDPQTVTPQELGSAMTGAKAAGPDRKSVV